MKKIKITEQIMLGAVLGDIIGSAYEWHNVKTKDFPLVTTGTKYTDDTVMALAVYLNKHHTSMPLEYRKKITTVRIESQFGYDLNRTLDEIRPTYQFDVSCKGSVPEAIIAYLESESLEDCVRNAISIGGDSDTIAAIACSIFMAGEDCQKEKNAWVDAFEKYLSADLKLIMEDFESAFSVHNNYKSKNIEHNKE